MIALLTDEDINEKIQINTALDDLKADENQTVVDAAYDAD